MLLAITRPISQSMENCELTHIERQPLNVNTAREQHRLYEQALASLGCKIERLPEEPFLPDSVFVEDAALVLNELAIITRPGAESRRAETQTVADGLRSYRQMVEIEAPGTIDGGDVLLVDKTMYIGLSLRTNSQAADQVRAAIEPLGYRVKTVTVTGCLHLKSAVTQVTKDTLLINPEWINADIFDGLKCITVDASEPHAANGLLIGETVLYPTAFPKTRAKLEEHHIPLLLVDVSEIAKAEGAVTCCSLILSV
jgi:dimethylargininase